MCAHMFMWVQSAYTAKWRRAHPHAWAHMAVHRPMSERHFLQAHSIRWGHLSLLN